MKNILKFWLKVSKLASFEYKAIHRKKTFGIIWKFLNPLMFIGVYTFVFSTLYSSGIRGYIISVGILVFSGISSTINSSTTWVQPKLINFVTPSYKLKILFLSKVYFNFVPIFYLLPIMIVVQRVFFNLDFKFTLLESLIIFLNTLILVFLTMIYSYLVAIPISILSKNFTDLKDLTSHFLRVILYLSPILWTAKTDIEIVNILLQILNPFYFIFEALNLVIYRNYDFSYLTLISPTIISILIYIFFIKNDKYVNKVKSLVYLNA